MRSCSNTDMALCKGLRNHVCKELRNAKAQYYISLSQRQEEIITMWKQINSMIKPCGAPKVPNGDIPHSKHDNKGRSPCSN